MGKKRVREEAQEEVEQDGELEAEMRALASIQQERAAPSEMVTQYNKEGLLRSIEGTSLPFEESMEVCEFSVQVQLENDDLERELAFYNQTVLAVNLGHARMDKLGIPARRPVDYFCEQIKSDAHMNKVKDRLLIEEKKIGIFEKRLERDSNKKFNKQLTAIKKQDQSKSTAKVVEAVTNLRKGREKGRVKDSVEEGLNKILSAGDEKHKSSKRLNMVSCSLHLAHLLMPSISAVLKYLRVYELMLSVCRIRSTALVAKTRRRGNSVIRSKNCHL